MEINSVEKSASNTNLENAFAQWLTFKNIQYVRQFQAIKDRRYKCDFYLPKWNVIIEIEGGQWIQGRHQRGSGFKNDIEKYNQLTLSGYRILRLTTDHFIRNGINSYAIGVYSSKLIDLIEESFGNGI